jgi:hypothetical protein
MMLDGIVLALCRIVGRQAQEEFCWLALLTTHTSWPDVDRLKEDAPMAAAKPHMCVEIGYAPKVATGQACS